MKNPIEQKRARPRRIEWPVTRPPKRPQRSAKFASFVTWLLVVCCIVAGAFFWWLGGV